MFHVEHLDPTRSCSNAGHEKATPHLTAKTAKYKKFSTAPLLWHYPVTSPRKEWK
jgi:hypothetical protein